MAQTRHAALSLPSGERSLVYGGFGPVLFELAIKGGFADAQQSCGGQLIAVGFAQGTQNRAALQLTQRHEFICLEQFFVGPVLQVRWKIADVQNGSGAERHCPLDGVLEFAHVSRQS